MPRVCFIVNPTAGHGRALAAWKQIEPLAAQLGDYEVKFTQGPREGEALARQAAQEGYDRVIAMGGDGTVNEVGNGVMGTGAALGVIPTGTGNDWVRSAGVPSDPEEGCRMAFLGELSKMDVGLAHGYRYFFNGAGFGFDAQVCVWVNEHGQAWKRVSGTLPHLMGVVNTLFAFTGVSVDVEIDGEKIHVPRLLLMALGNGQYFGGGMRVVPDARLDDGLFDLAWGENLSRMELIGLVSKIYKGAHVGHPKVRMARGRKVTATSSARVPFQLDGDVAGHLPVTFEVLPQALDVILPKS